MKSSAPLRSMSATDAAFLYVERPHVPLHIASVCIFDGPIPFRQFLAGINAKLHLVPRYRQIPVMPPWDLEFPSWRDDPNFDIHRHVIPVTLAQPGGEAELEALAGRILSQLLDRNKPLWDVHVVDGLKDGRGALIWRVHHALADGVSGAELMKLLLDSTPDVPAVYPKPRYRRSRAQPAPAPSSTGACDTITTLLRRMLAFEGDMLTLTEAMLGDATKSPLKGLLELVPEFSVSIERLPFNKPCDGDRSFCWAEFELADIQTIRESIGGTVNDVILALLTSALSRYVKLHGESVVRRLARIVCPVSLRPSQRNIQLGNQISFLPIALPLDARGPVRTLRAVIARTEVLKRCGALGFVALAAKWLSATPPPLQALFWRTIPEVILPVPLLNMICTNVVGSTVPLYAAGRRMLAAYPQVPTGWELGVGFAAHSYDGKLFFGILADTHAAPDAHRLRDFLVRSFRELHRAAISKKASTKPSRPTSARRASSAKAEPLPENSIRVEPAPSVDPAPVEHGSSETPHELEHEEIVV